MDEEVGIVRQFARQLVDWHGEAALQEAEERVAHALNQGDAVMVRAWLDIEAAVREELHAGK